MQNQCDYTVEAKKITYPSTCAEVYALLAQGYNHPFLVSFDDYKTY